ncbi:hypothetical protein AGLY_003660 [Aphis glycines]|uniref:Uncharacterized protein n=1 Tax=Aphis glycines TaxID=307491 RepID=A0A6G0TYU3_APHGL|nr:hypothetical protein AGLY_003660 [Aphis glycines]
MSAAVVVVVVAAAAAVVVAVVADVVEIAHRLERLVHFLGSLLAPVQILLYLIQRSKSGSTPLLVAPTGKSESNCLLLRPSLSHIWVMLAKKCKLERNSGELFVSNTELEDRFQIGIQTISICLRYLGFCVWWHSIWRALTKSFQKVPIEIRSWQWFFFNKLRTFNRFGRLFFNLSTHWSPRISKAKHVRLNFFPFSSMPSSLASTGSFQTTELLLGRSLLQISTDSVLMGSEDQLAESHLFLDTLTLASPFHMLDGFLSSFFSSGLFQPDVRTLQS